MGVQGRPLGAQVPLGGKYFVYSGGSVGPKDAGVGSWGSFVPARSQFLPTLRGLTQVISRGSPCSTRDVCQ